MKDILTRMADVGDPGSLSNRLRGKRFRLFMSLLDQVPRPIRLLDVGGTSAFWAMRNFQLQGLDIICLNVVEETESSVPNCQSIGGDARDLSRFDSGAFDIVFSNSVIEHMGDKTSRERMANEIRRVGRRYFVQTPSRSFPIEPHFLFPFYQFLPRGLRAWLLMHFSLGWFPKAATRVEAEEVVDSIELLDEREMRQLFPEARISRERFLGLTKSLTAYHGW